MLRVEFKVDEALKKKFSQVGQDNKLLAIIAVVDKKEVVEENFVLEGDHDLNGTLEAVREQIKKEGLECAYIVIRIDVNQPGLAVFVSDNAKAKDRMVYSSGTGNLQELLQVSAAYTAQASSLEELQPSLFNRKETASGRQDLMTESERIQDKISKMEVAPQPSILPGLSTPVSTAAQQALDSFAKRELAIVTFKIEDGKIDVDQKSGDSKGLDSVVGMLPKDHPRYIITRFTPKAVKEERSVMIYVCPGSCPPKEKMPYASSKAPFIAFMSDRGVELEKRVECGTVDEMIQTVEDHFVEVDFGDSETPKKAAPKPGMVKGPRMLI